MSELISFAREELNRLGLFDADSDYGGELGKATMELIETLAKQGHSGMSAAGVVKLFSRLANFKPLTHITANPDEWRAIAPNTWICKRCLNLIREGDTYYDCSGESRKEIHLPYYPM